MRDSDRKSILVIFLLQLSLGFGEEFLYNDPEVFMNTPQILERWGYPSEAHNVTTEDGYIIEIHRIPHGIKEEANSSRPVIFLQPGFNCDSAYFLSNLPNESAGFVFADAGFDVWIGNIRGNRYGRNHVSLKPNDKKLWDFNVDHMAKYDLPAMIDYVLNATGQESLNYVAHSQGTLSMFMRLSENEEMNKKIKKYFALAPIGSVKNIRGAFRVLYDLGGVQASVLYRLVGPGEFSMNPTVKTTIARYVCGNAAMSERCRNMYYLIGGPNSQQSNNTRTSVYMAQSRSGTSTENVVHWMQMIKSGKMQKFDYEKKKNQEVYKQPTPSVYDISKITVPIYLYWGDADYLATKKDIEEYLLPKLKTVKENNFLPRYNHADFAWGMNATSDIYFPILKILQDDKN